MAFIRFAALIVPLLATYVPVLCFRREKFEFEMRWVKSRHGTQFGGWVKHFLNELDNFHNRKLYEI